MHRNFQTLETDQAQNARIPTRWCHYGYDVINKYLGYHVGVECIDVLVSNICKKHIDFNLQVNETLGIYILRYRAYVSCWNIGIYYNLHLVFGHWKWETANCNQNNDISAFAQLPK